MSCIVAKYSPSMVGDVQYFSLSRGRMSPSPPLRCYCPHGKCYNRRRYEYCGPLTHPGAVKRFPPPRPVGVDDSSVLKYFQEACCVFRSARRRSCISFTPRYLRRLQNWPEHSYGGESACMSTERGGHIILRRTTAVLPIYIFDIVTYLCTGDGNKGCVESVSSAQQNRRCIRQGCVQHLWRPLSQSVMLI